jgi:membrane-associated phospholipid phosphatase
MRRTGIAGALIAVLVATYVVAFGSESLAMRDLDAVSDPRTGEFRAVATVVYMLSPALVAGAASLALLAIALLAQAYHVGGVRVAMRTCAVVAGCFLTGEIAKWSIGEFHPPAEAAEHAAAVSFPSVHAAVAMVLAVGLARLTPGHRALLASLYPAGMGAFTVLVGWHFPSDAIAGCLFGAAWACAIPRPFGVTKTSAVAVVSAALAAILGIGLLVGYGRSFGDAAIVGEPFAAGAIAIAVTAAVAAVAAVAAGISDAGNPRPSSGAGATARR